MTERQYLPADWMDEISPPMQTDPSAFARRDPDGSWSLVPVNGLYDDEDEWHHLTARLSAGDVIAFATIEDSGEATLTVHDDGTWSADPQIPAGVNWIWIIGELETCNTSVDSLIRDSELEPVGCCDVQWFIQGHAHLRFAPDGDAPRFVAVEDQSHG